MLHVICKVAGTEYAIPADNVFQLESFSGATPIPGAASYVTGLVQIRQQIIAVLNVRLRLGLPASEPTADSRVIVVKLGTRLVGFLVDSAREVLDIRPEQFMDPPAILSSPSTGFVKSIVQSKERIIMLLDAPRVVGEEPAHV